MRKARVFVGRLRGRGKEYSSYSKEKFSGLDLSEMQRDLLRYQEIARLSGVETIPLTVREGDNASGCFIISKAVAS